MIRLPTPRRYGVYGVAVGLWLSGAVWLIAHYWLVRQGEYGPETSPVEPLSLKVHGGFAMAGLWFLGLLWGVHVVAGWRMRRGRLTGALLFGSLGPLVGTGWLLYYLGDETWRAWASIAHWTIGLAALPLFLWHRFARKPIRRRGRDPSLAAEDAEVAGR